MTINCARWPLAHPAFSNPVQRSIVAGLAIDEFVVATHKRRAVGRSSRTWGQPTFSTLGLLIGFLANAFLAILWPLLRQAVEEPSAAYPTLEHGEG